MGSNCLCCSYLRCCGRSLCHLILSQEEGVRRKRRLIWGVIVLLIVDVIWVGSAELTDVSKISHFTFNRMHQSLSMGE